MTTLAQMGYLFVSDNMSGDEFLHDLVGAAIDGLNTCIHKGLSNGILPHISPTSVHLQAQGGHLVL